MKKVVLCFIMCLMFFGESIHCYANDGTNDTSVKSSLNTHDSKDNGAISSQVTSDSSVSQVNNETVEKPVISYSTHVQNEGWQKNVENGAVSGTTGQRLRLEAIKIQVANLNKTYPGGVTYSTHVQNIGWQSYLSNGESAGTTGRSLRLEAIKINLTGELSKHYDVYYRVHVENFGWLSWGKNDDPVGSAGFASRLEAIQIKLVAKGTAFSEDQLRPFISASSISYQSHVQNIGWQSSVNNGEISGTTGKGLRMEALRINTINNGLGGSIVYQGHVQDVGWQSEVGNNVITGTVGQGKRLEALKVSLRGELSKYYDVYYRAHVENKGWLDWTKNGGIIGSIGASKRMESVQILLVLKGATAPAIGNHSYATINDFPRPKPTYFSQLDSRWSKNKFNSSTIGPTGCVPTSLAMILHGSYGMNLSPADVAKRMDGFSPWAIGASGKDIVVTAKSYGRSVEQISSQSRAQLLLSQGIPLIMIENVGIDPAVTVYGYNNGKTEVFDPYNKMFFQGWNSLNYMWNKVGTDSVDWDAGRPVFAIR